MPKKKILIIDNEPSITKLLKFMLEKTGIYEISCLNDPTKAIATVRSEGPDLLILDLNMPQTSGSEIAESLKADPALKGILVVYLTGNVSREEADEGLVIGGHPALSKPIDIEKLLECLTKCLA